MVCINTMTLQQLLTDDLWRKIYEYDYTMYPVNRASRELVNKERNRAATIISRFIKRNKIFDEMPIMFMADFYSGKIPKWLLIRIYMKFYPKPDLCDLPKNIIQMNYTTSDVRNNKCIRSIWFKFNRPHKYLVTSMRKYELFEVLHSFTMYQIINAGV